MQETQVNEQEHAQIIQNLAWLTKKFDWNSDFDENMFCVTEILQQTVQ